MLTQKFGWPWIFWTLTILSGLCLFLLYTFLPETARNVVGNGSFPAVGINKTLYSAICGKKSSVDKRMVLSRRKGIRFPNPIKCLFVLFSKNNMLVVVVNGILYMAYCCVQASLASLFIELYNFSEIDAGLIYLPFESGCLIASFLAGWKAISHA